MTLQTPMWSPGASHSVQVAQQAVAAVHKQGVCNWLDLRVGQRGAGANMSIDVTPGRCVINNRICWSDAIENRTIASAPPQGLFRFDSIQARLSGSSSWTIVVVTGTAAASPQPPAVPGNAVELAHVFLRSNTTSVQNAIITDRRTPSTAGLLWPETPPIDAGWDSAGTLIVGPSGRLEVHDGFQWRLHDPNAAAAEILRHQGQHRAEPVVRRSNFSAEQTRDVGNNQNLHTIDLDSNERYRIVATYTGEVRRSTSGTSVVSVDLACLSDVTTVQTMRASGLAQQSLVAPSVTLATQVTATIGPSTQLNRVQARLNVANQAVLVGNSSLIVTAHKG